MKMSESNGSALRRMVQICFLVTSVLLVSKIFAQPLEQPVKIIVSPDHADWKYNVGEKTVFNIAVFKNNVAWKGVKINYQVGPERMVPTKKETAIISTDHLTVDGGTMKHPGFLRCIVTCEFEGKQYRGLATAGFSVSEIKPTVTCPRDFDSFWEKAKQELKQIPLDIKLIPLPEKSSALSNVYMVNVQGYNNSRLYGMLAVPKKEGKYPAVLEVPGAGIRPYSPNLEMADRGVIVFNIGIHGIPVNLDPVVYNNLEAGALKGYFFFNCDNKDRYYYKRVYLNCIRANDVIESLPQFDGVNLAVSGNSQGGALSIVTAALDKRVKHLAVIHPALCDLTGYFFGRAGGWPHIFSADNFWYNNSKETRETMPYYDVVNFAKEVNVPGYYTWGFNDETCPPTSMFAAYNVINSNKQIELFPDTGHWFYPEQKAKFSNWIISRLEATKKIKADQ